MPFSKPNTVAEGSFTLLKPTEVSVLVPAADQVPLPADGAVAANVVWVVFPHNIWSAPALLLSLLFIVTVNEFSA